MRISFEDQFGLRKSTLGQNFYFILPEDKSLPEIILMLHDKELKLSNGTGTEPFRKRTQLSNLHRCPIISDSDLCRQASYIFEAVKGKAATWGQ